MELPMGIPTRGHLIVISGPSGVGKTALVDFLLAEYPCERCVTATTRAPRDGEKDGIDYHFFDRSAFEEGLGRGEFLEHAEVYGNLYGTPLGPIRAQLEAGKTVLLAIDVQGATQLMDRGLPAQFCFIEAPSWEELESRLRGRNSEEEAAIERRLQTARDELAVKDRYDVSIVNDRLADAARRFADWAGLPPIESPSVTRKPSKSELPPEIGDAETEKTS